MKNMSKYIAEKLKVNPNKSAIEKTEWEFGVQGSEVTDNVDCMLLTMNDNEKKKYGFISYNNTDDYVSVMTFDSIEDLAEAYSCDTIAFEDLEDAMVGEVVNGDDDEVYIRIW